jgi:hypothetical protein
MRRAYWIPLLIWWSVATVAGAQPDQPGPTQSPVQRDPFEDSPPVKEPTHPSLLPPYLPRSAFVGSWLNSGALTAQVRLQWELTLVQERVDAFVLLFQGGGGYGLVLPQNLGPARTSAMMSLYQHTLLAGLAFRADRPSGFHWGFQAATGPLFYGARFTDLPSESGVAGLVEGRADVGWKYGSIVYGISFGYGSLYQQPTRLESGSFLGGILFGLFADAR